MADAFVLAAGFGTRLRPLTHHLPKPLVPVCGVPMLSYALALCAAHGLRSAIVNAHWLAGALADWEGEREGVRVTISVETPEILGTGGGLKRVSDLLAERFAVVNGDVLTNVDLTALLAQVTPGSGALALRPSDDPERYGVVAADATGTLVKMREIASAPPHGPVDRNTHFTGIHAMHRDALALVPDGFACVVRTAYKELVPQRRVRAIVHRGLWLDVGDPPAYLAANLAALAGDLALPLDPFSRAAWSSRHAGDAELVAGVEVAGNAWVGEGARIGPGARLEDVVVGAGATVPAGAHLRRVVIWDDTAAPAGRLENAVVHTGGVLAIT